MKKIIFAVLFFANFSFGVSLMDKEIFDSSDNIKIELKFDKAYKADVSSKKEGKNYILTLKNVVSDEKFTGQINSKILSEFSIIPKGNETQIILLNGENLNVEAGLKNNNLSLVLTISDPNLNKLTIKSKDEIKTEKKPFDFMPIIVILIIILILILVYYITKKISNKKPKNQVGDVWEIPDSIENEENTVTKNNDILEDINLANLDKNDEFDVDFMDIDVKDKFTNFDLDEKTESVENLDKDEVDKFENKENFTTLEEFIKEHEDSEIQRIVEEQNLQKFENNEEIEIVVVKKIQNSTAVILKYKDKQHLVVLNENNYF